MKPIRSYVIPIAKIALAVNFLNAATAERTAEPQLPQSNLHRLNSSFEALAVKERDELGPLKDSWVPGFKQVVAKNDPQALLDYLVPVVGKHPVNLATYWAYDRIGMAYSTLGKPDEADKWLRKGIEALDTLVNRYQHRPESVKLIIYYDNLLRRLSKKIPADFDRVKCKYDWASAQPAYAQFNDCVLLGLVHLYMGQSQYENALATCTALDEFYKAQPPNEKNRLGHYMFHAEALAKLNRKPESLAVLKAAKGTPWGGFDESLSRMIAELEHEHAPSASPATQAESDPPPRAGEQASGGCCQKPAGDKMQSASSGAKDGGHKSQSPPKCTCGTGSKPGDNGSSDHAACCSSGSKPSGDGQPKVSNEAPVPVKKE